uniref:Proteasome activator complex subunit 1 n=1 Tax=Saimiri boliviensis boliviensis TaxID=39432 RepID=A0A2K6S7Q4_SAIBB
MLGPPALAKAMLRVQPETQAKVWDACVPQVDVFHEDPCTKTENLLRSYFPKQISELDAFLKEPALMKAPLDIPVPDPQEKEDKDDKKKGEVEDKGPPCGPVNCNEEITVLLQCLKPEIKDGTEQLNLEKVFEPMTMTEAAKQPHVSDYWQQVQELDEAEYQDIQLMVMEIHRAYAVLYDIILKNLDKLRKPRGETKGMTY